MADFDQVSLVDVSRHFGRRRAVSQVTLSARRGEIVGLLGPNGAGKSTLIGMAATLVSPTSGEVRYGSVPLASSVRRCAFRSASSRTSCISIPS